MHNATSSSCAQVHLKYINRDAVAALLGLAGPQVHTRPVPVIDLRRHDERTLYGSIPGTPLFVETSISIVACYQKCVHGI